MLFIAHQGITLGTVTASESDRCVLLEVYYRDGENDHQQAVAAAQEIREARGGITIVLREVGANKKNQQRLDAILKHYRVEPQTTPVIYGCNRLIHRTSATSTWHSQLLRMLEVEVFVRSGCSRCAAAKEWLPAFMRQYPGVKVTYRDLTTDSSNVSKLNQLVARHRTTAASVPVFHLCDSLFVGFDRMETTGERLDNTLKHWTHVCPDSARNSGPNSDHKPNQSPRQTDPQTSSFSPVNLAKPAIAMLLAFRDSAVLAHHLIRLLQPQASNDSQNAQTDGVAQGSESGAPPSVRDELSLPLPGDESPILPEDELSLPGKEDDDQKSDLKPDDIDVPVLGRLNASQLGMPLFTLAIGLVDGFNPCAMWVLLFLLSILVNLKDRRRIMAIAGSFVVVSGLAYFAFMAAWLNVFMLIGYLRPIQIGLALLAIVIGSIHVKDFFAFKQGVSLSIPESAKPGIYARVRRIVTAEHLAGAVVGAVTLAILVNIIELLCTAGLPALYTNILTQQGYSSSVKYAYLGLYIAAYMFDDSLMVLIVVMTLSKRKLQEGQGRWLKLLSGAAILLLGVVMLFRPDWLQ